MAVNLSEVAPSEILGSEDMVVEKLMTDLKKGEQGVILNAPNNTLLASLGLRQGKTVLVKAKQVLNGPLICSVDGRNVALSQDIAADVVVSCR